MTAEIWIIIGVGVALATLIVGCHRRLRSRLDALYGERPEAELLGEVKQMSEWLAETTASAKRMELIVGDVYEMTGLARPEPYESTDRTTDTDAKPHIVLVKDVTGGKQSGDGRVQGQ